MIFFSSVLGIMQVQFQSNLSIGGSAKSAKKHAVLWVLFAIKSVHTETVTVLDFH